jgi:hypothetical protein
VGIDPALWFDMVKTYADTNPENTGAEGRQHHHGTHWQYGGVADVHRAATIARAPGWYSSLHHDLVGGKRLELAALHGSVVRRTARGDPSRPTRQSMRSWRRGRLG